MLFFCIVVLVIPKIAYGGRIQLTQKQSLMEMKSQVE